MANAWFPKGIKKIGNGGIDLDTDDLRVMLVKSTYTYDSTDEFLSDLGAVDNGRSATLATPSVADDGIFDAENTSLTATDAAACNAYIIFKHTGSDATASVILYEDTPSSGLPFTPSASGSVTIIWDDGANKIGKY